MGKMNRSRLLLVACLLPLLVSSCGYSSSSGFRLFDDDDHEERQRRRAVDRKTDRILEVGRTKDRAEARRQANGEVFEDEFFRSNRP